LAHLAPCKSLKNVALIETGITDAGIENLKKVKSLGSIYLGGSKVTPAGRAELNKAFPEGYVPD